jgi:MoxR-like ATPase
MSERENHPYREVRGLSQSTATRTEVQRLFDLVRERLTRVVAVEPEVLEPLLVALLAQGHVLIEGIPGIGKTLLARTLARCLDCEFRRIQFTNDLMPSDIVGSSIWKPGSESFVFVKGPLFADIVLADEINRTSPRTLSCLLEAMENGTVSVEGRSARLGTPFIVLATRNPIELHGTYPIPEAALDRFLLHLRLSYPRETKELALYTGHRPEDLLESVEPAFSKDQLLQAMQEVHHVVVSEPVANYCYRLIVATREHPDVSLGASPRAALALLQAARARALLDGRDYVLPDDLKALAPPVLTHRILLKGGGQAHSVVTQALETTPVDL